jgi:putative acetyltransferase
MRPLQIRDLESGDRQAAALVEQLDALQGSLYPDESNHLEPMAELFRAHFEFLGAFDGGTLVACGAAKRVDDTYGELKRMYVSPLHRRRGAAATILRALEQRLRARGIRLVRLETGIRQADALAFYRAHGYRSIAPFGAYRPDPLSVFMEKSLD